MIAIPTEYVFNISNGQVSDISSLVSIIYHNGNSMSTGHYYSDILYFKTGVFWRCDDRNITKVKIIVYYCYSNVTLKYTGEKVKP